MNLNSLVYQFISTTFCVIVLLSNIISVKLIELPLFNLVLPLGLLTYPLTFLLSGLVTEIFGPKKARHMIYITLAMNILGFAILQFALIVPSSNSEKDSAFKCVLGLSGLRILSSLIAYFSAHIADIQIYSRIKHFTGNRFLWLRNNVSTWISQFIDTALVDLIYLYGGLGMHLNTVFSIIGFSYLYKIIFCLFTTPILYFLVFFIKKRQQQTVF